MKSGVGKQVRWARDSCCSPYQWGFTFDIFRDISARLDDDPYVASFELFELSLGTQRESLAPNHLLLAERFPNHITYSLQACAVMLEVCETSFTCASETT
jgi:hypothetical protein